MHDIKYIRENPAAFDAGLKRRHLEPVAQEILAMDAARRAGQTEMQELQAKRNEVSKQIGGIKQKGGDATPLMEEVARIKERLAQLESSEKDQAQALQDRLAAIPNLPASDVPDGKDETDNKELRKSGSPKLINSAKQHFDLGEALGLMDFEAAAKLSGARFTVLKGGLARLERALGNFMLDTLTGQFGFDEISPPLLVRDEIMYGTAQLPKFEEDQFWAVKGEFFTNPAEPQATLDQLRKTRLGLIPTAEVPLTNLVNDMIIEREKLPLRMTARTPCFRAEAGAAGRDTRGMLRQHQFYKVEMVSITAPDQSEAEHERMTDAAETVLKKLELPFRTIVLCTGDMGFAARKTYDIEVWMPGQNTYREISSCSNCGDFQARRMNARMRAAGEKNTEFVHTLNGSGVAVGRCLIAIMENYQQQDGSIAIPACLRDYMGGLEKIG